MDSQTDALLRDVISQISDMNKSIGSLEASVENLAHDAGRQVSDATAERHDMQVTITDIRREMGAIEGRLAVGSERHRDFAKSLDTVNASTSKIEIEIAKIAPLAVAVTEMKPQVKELMEFKGRIAAIMLMASSLVGAAFWFIWEGFKWFFPDVKDMIVRLFH